MKAKSFILCITSFLAGVAVVVLYLSHYFVYEGKRTIRIKEFPDWASTIVYKYEAATVSVCELGCLMDCDKEKYGRLEGVPQNGKFWFIYSGSGSTPINSDK